MTLDFDRLFCAGNSYLNCELPSFGNFSINLILACLFKITSSPPPEIVSTVAFVSVKLFSQVFLSHSGNVDEANTWHLFVRSVSRIPPWTGKQRNPFSNSGTCLLPSGASGSSLSLCILVLQQSLGAEGLLEAGHQYLGGKIGGVLLWRWHSLYNCRQVNSKLSELHGPKGNVRLIWTLNSTVSFRTLILLAQMESLTKWKEFKMRVA